MSVDGNFSIFTIAKGKNTPVYFRVRILRRLTDFVQGSYFEKFLLAKIFKVEKKSDLKLEMFQKTS